MLTGLDILIARMKDHPEEFRRDGKWTDLLTAIDKHLTEEEKQALRQGFTDMARDMFNEVVLKTIANEEIHWDDVNSINIDYDTVMSYPMEKKRMAEEEQRQRMEQRLMADKMRMEMELKQQRAMQGSPYNQGMGGLGVIGNQARGVW